MVSGKPQSGMQVTLLTFRTENQQRYSSRIDFAVTDEKGQYLFEMLEPGEEYAVAFQEPGYTQEQSASFKPKPGELANVTPLELLQADRFVAGVVVDSDGKPVEGAVVGASHRNGRAIGGAFTREPTGKDGRFRIQGVPNVPLSLTVYLPPPPGSSARKTGPFPLPSTPTRTRPTSALCSTQRRRKRRRSEPRPLHLFLLRKEQVEQIVAFRGERVGKSKGDPNLRSDLSPP